MPTTLPSHFIEVVRRREVVRLEQLAVGEIRLEVLDHLPRDVLRHAGGLDTKDVGWVASGIHRVQPGEVARNDLDLQLRRVLQGLAVVVVELVRVRHDDNFAASGGFAGLTGRENGCGRGGRGQGAGSDQHLAA